jgi:hypothetical protein
MRLSLLFVAVAVLCACSGPKLPAPNSADVRYDQRQQAVQLMVSGMQPASAAALVADDGARYPASGIALVSGPHVLYNPPPSIGLGIRRVWHFRLLQRVWFGSWRGTSGWPAHARRDQRPVCGVGPDPRARRLRRQLDDLSSGGFRRRAGDAAHCAVARRVSSPVALPDMARRGRRRIKANPATDVGERDRRANCLDRSYEIRRSKSFAEIGNIVFVLYQ